MVIGKILRRFRKKPVRVDGSRVEHVLRNENLDSVKKQVSKKKETKKITANTKLNDILRINPEAGMVLYESGMHCLGCGMAAQENLEEGCMAHGMNKKEINELIKKLNKK